MLSKTINHTFLCFFSHQNLLLIILRVPCQVLFRQIRETNIVTKLSVLVDFLRIWEKFSVIFTIFLIFYQISNEILRVAKFGFLKIRVLRISCCCVSVYYIVYELRLAMPKLLQSRLGLAEHFKIKWGTSRARPDCSRVWNKRSLW